jgi:flagellar biosynthesis protein FlhG
MIRLLPIASGKGGVGKSVIAANLGLALSRDGGSGPARRAGRAVVLVDLDLGCSNLHTCLGVKNRHPGIGALAWKRERALGDLLVETGHERLWLVPGDGLLPGTGNIEWFAKRRILKELEDLPADFAILDLGAGSSYNVVDFFLASDEGLLVVKPEITSVLNAYALLKTAAYRLLSRSFPEKSPGRAAVHDFAAAKREGAGPTFLDFARDLADRSPEGPAALEKLGALRPLAVVNMGRGPNDAELCRRLRDIVARNLGISLAFAGYIVDDPALPASIAARRPLLDSDPSSPFSRALAALASVLAAHRIGAGPAPPPRNSDEDIAALVAAGLAGGP